MLHLITIIYKLYSIIENCILKKYNILNIFISILICFLDVLRKLGFQKESIKENSIDEEEEIPEV